MERRKAYILREVLIVYNFALVLLSAGTMYEVSTEVSSCVFPWSVFPILAFNFRSLFDLFRVCAVARSVGAEYSELSLLV